MRSSNLVIFAFMVFTFGCVSNNGQDEKCLERREYTYYSNGNKNTIVIYDTLCNIFNYVRLDPYKNKKFGYFYQDDYPIEGFPIIHTFWSDFNPSEGDTLLMMIDIANPPGIEVRFYVEDESGVREFSHDEIIDFAVTIEDDNGYEYEDTLKCYKYERIASRNIDSFKFLVKIFPVHRDTVYIFDRSIPVRSIISRSDITTTNLDN